MFTTAFDAAGKDDPKIPCLVVAGFVGTADGWIEFESEWKKRLGPLSVWETAQMARARPDILQSLVAMVPAYGFRKFAVGVDRDDLKSVPDDIRNNFQLHAYPLCARTLVTQVDLWAMYERIPRERVHYVFEEGESRTEQQALTDLMLEDGFPRPDFRWKKDCVIHGHPHKGFTPLQAADILAWHLYQIQKDWVLLPEAQRTTDAALRICRLPFPELESLPETPRKITPGDLQKYIESRAYMDLRRKLIAAQGDAPFNLESL